MLLLQARRSLQKGGFGNFKRRACLAARECNSTVGLEIGEVLGKAGTWLKHLIEIWPQYVQFSIRNKRLTGCVS